MSRVENEYGYVFLDRIMESQYGDWTGGLYIKPSKELSSISREEYEYAFPEAVNYGKFQRLLEANELPIYSLYSINTKDQINDYLNNDCLIAYKSPDDPFNILIENRIEIEIKNIEGQYVMPFDVLCDKVKESIYGDLSVGDTSGKFKGGDMMNRYTIMQKTSNDKYPDYDMEAYGRIEKLMYLYEKGDVITNYNALKAALFNEGKFDYLEKVKRETHNLTNVIEKATKDAEKIREAKHCEPEKKSFLEKCRRLMR